MLFLFVLLIFLFLLLPDELTLQRLHRLDLHNKPQAIEQTSGGEGPGAENIDDIGPSNHLPITQELQMPIVVCTSSALPPFPPTERHASLKTNLLLDGVHLDWVGDDSLAGLQLLLLDGKEGV